MFNNSKYLDDLKNQLKYIDLDKLKNKKILITGANGLICSYIIDLLIFANINQKANITILAMSRNLRKLKERFKYYYNDKLFVPIIQDVCELYNCENLDYIIHGASNANPTLFINDPIGTMNANYIGTLNMLKLAKKNNSKMVYISSSDIYGLVSDNNSLKENQYGYIDFLNIKSSYASSKRCAETLCVSFCSQYNIDVKIVRPAHIYGPTYTESDTRAISNFIMTAINKKNVVMKSNGSSIRSYCYVGDCAIGIFQILLSGVAGNAYNLSNNNSLISIKDMAKIICDYCNVKLEIKLPVNDIDIKIDSNVKFIKINSDKLENLGWTPKINIQDGIKLTIDILKFEDK